MKSKGQKMQARKGIRTMVPSSMAAARFTIGDAMFRPAVARRAAMVVLRYMIMVKEIAKGIFNQ